MTPIKSTLAMAALVTSLAVTAWAAAPGATAAPAGGGDRGAARGTPGAGAPQGGRQTRGANQAPAGLGQAMTDMDRAYNAIKADAADPTKQEATLHNIDIMIRDAAIAKLLVPPVVNRAPADKKADSLKSYRSMMTGLIKSLLDLEEAVNDKKPDEIKKGIAQLEEIQKQGHAEFAPQGR